MRHDHASAESIFRAAEENEKMSIRLVKPFVAVLLWVGLLAAQSSPALAEFGIQPGTFGVTTTRNDGTSWTQAGAHANLTVEFLMNRTVDAQGHDVPDGDLRDVRVELPPGAIGDPNSAPACALRDFNGANNSEGILECPKETQIGVITVDLQNASFAERERWRKPIYNLEHEEGKPALFGFRVFRTNVMTDVHIRTESDYGVTAVIRDIPSGLLTGGSTATFWGVPQEPAHDPERFNVSGTAEEASSVGDPPAPLMSNPTSCGGNRSVTITVRSWQEPDRWVSEESQVPGNTGCERLPFSPTIKVAPTTDSADSSTGLNIDLHLPQSEDPNGLATAHLKRAEVTLPEGMSVNPSSADGLGACSEDQVALKSDTPASCPDSSKIGSVEIETPVLDTPMKGSVYLAEQGTNPFQSLLALYLVAEGEGVTVKLPGKVSPDPVSGQLKAVFDNSPQLPFENLHMTLKSGSRGSLVTPPACGIYTAEASFTSWAQPGNPVPASSSFDVSSGPGGGACPTGNGFATGLEAGTVMPLAGTYSPLIVRATRADGSKPLTALEVKLPPGLIGKLASLSNCPDATLAAAEQRSGRDELAAPSCPASSKVGTVTIGAGAGSTPFHVTGSAYLAGPYKGAPISLAVITPAVAGPLDLGTVVIRNALGIDPITTQVTALSDPIPTILEGIPLKLRSVEVSADRPEFTLNPTSCEPMEASGTLFGSGVSSAFSNRFQVGGCAGLGFKPKLALKFSGPTHRSAHPGLKATLTMPKGGANIGKAVVTLPKTEFLENAHIRTICTRVQYAAENCPKGSVYGYAKAWTPLLDKPLQGPVYLRSSNHTLPDLVASLDGQIHVDLAGRIDSPGGKIRNTFWAVPDAPVSKFTLTMQGGKKGLLANNEELCKVKPRAKAEFTGQNGKRSVSKPLVSLECGKGKGKR